VRSRIILLAAEGVTIRQIARRLHVSPTTVRLWCLRFAHTGSAALSRDRPRGGRQPGRSATRVLAILRAMRDGGPRQPPWTTRALADSVGTSAATVWRVWKHFGIGAASSIAEIDRAIAQAINETANRAK
jgi:transposase